MEYSAKTLTPVQVGQVVKALVLLGARKIIVEEVEKDRFVVTTTTEAAHSKNEIRKHKERNDDRAFAL